MTTENKTPDLPAFDPKADRGDVVDAAKTTPLVVELTADELKLIGKADAPAPKAEDAAAAAKAAADRGDTIAEPDKEPDKNDTKPRESSTNTEDSEQKDPAKDPAKTEETPRDEKGKFIPKARFDEVNNRAKAKVAELEGRIKQLESTQGKPSTPADVAALETELSTKGKEYTQLLADGELDKANALLTDINKINRKIGVIEATALNNAHTTEVQHVSTLEELVGIYKENYPQFDDANTDHYNQDMVNYVAKLQGGFELGGMAPAEALREAVEAAVAKFGLDPEPAAAAAKEDEKPAPTKGDERKAAAVEKAIAASSAQPKPLDKVGSDSDSGGMSKIDVGALSYQQFEALPESTLARLRGDNV